MAGCLVCLAAREPSNTLKMNKVYSSLSFCESELTASDALENNYTEYI